MISGAAVSSGSHEMKQLVRKYSLGGRVMRVLWRKSVSPASTSMRSRNEPIQPAPDSRTPTRNFGNRSNVAYAKNDENAVITPWRTDTLLMKPPSGPPTPGVLEWSRKRYSVLQNSGS